MASAAAVAANNEAPSLPNQFDEDAPVSGGIVSADNDEEDEEDAVRTSRKRTDADHQDLFDDDADQMPAGEDEEDLFGEDEAEDEPKRRRQLDDEELDSGDDLDRNDRQAIEDDDDGAEDEEKNFKYMNVDIGRHPLPEPSDGEIYMLKVPQFMSLDPTIFKPETFQVPETDHHSRGPPSATFSKFDTALTTLRWRYSPSKPDELQSNARILRWSDGSLTLQLGSDPTTQYTIDGKPLAPPQLHPSKPTPNAPKERKGRDHRERPSAYDHTQDSLTYLLSPSGEAQVIRTVGKVTCGLQIQPSAATTDAALEKLQTSLANAVRNRGGTTTTTLNGGGAGGGAGGVGGAGNGDIDFIRVTEDPELAKKKAELAERDKVRAQRRREAAENRDRERANRVLGRSGLRTGGGGGGLTTDLLEGEEGGGGRTRAKPKRRPRRMDEYSDEDEYAGRRRNTKEDEYDVDDGFLANSDEEEEIVEDDEDEDDGIVEDRRSPKRHRAEREEPDEPSEARDGSPVRTKKRRVVDEDDDDE
ncbi:MAG: hypothetical protein M1821_005481 [Bathelium mastoideum]|nr:MAG: hypothetical protein M1821_005481 [Bathelium mastoideum]KAI9691810.1 MAG: hypothetical protein M1822_007882 [Bathelium mastoideum]